MEKLQCYLWICQHGLHLQLIIFSIFAEQLSFSVYSLWWNISLWNALIIHITGSFSPGEMKYIFFQYWLEFPGRGSVWINVMQLPSSGPTYCSQGWSNRWAQHGASPKDKHFQKDDCSEIPTVTYISHCGYDEYIKRRSYLALSFFVFFFLVTHVFLLVRHF